jgi:hypothetical protein
VDTIEVSAEQDGMVMAEYGRGYKVGDNASPGARAGRAFARRSKGGRVILLAILDLRFAIGSSSCLIIELLIYSPNAIENRRSKI